MSKKMKTTTITFTDFHDPDFKNPSKWFIQTALGDYLFIHCRDKAKATEYVKEEYDGKYKIRSGNIEKGNGEISCRGFSNSKSRAGSNLVSIRNNQGRGL